MTTDNTKSSIYLAALLQHIPHEKVKAKFQQLISLDKPLFESVLTKADHYALTRAGNITHPFVYTYVGSPFENLKSQSGQYQYKVPALTLSLSEDLFPTQHYEPKGDKINTLWTQFGQEMDKLDWTETHQKRVADTVLSLLFKYAIAIPNPSNLHQEVAWYDYAKMKAGLAVCVYDYLQDSKKDLAYSIQEEDEPILLIRADLSGIQKFILDIASKQASKNLKGRSFYIQLLGDTVLKLLLKEFNLYNGNVMYASGGNFFLIAPHTAKVQTAYDNLEHRITKAIFLEHGTRISVVMGCQEVSQKEILDGKINDAIKKLFEEKIDRNKKRKFASLIEEDYAKFFEPSDIGGEAITDSISGEEILEEKKNVYSISENTSLPHKANKNDWEEGNDLMKEVTAKQIFLGHNLKDVKYLIATAEKLNLDLNRAEELVVSPCNLDIHFYIVKSEHVNSFKNALKDMDDYEVFTINDTESSATLNNSGRVTSIPMLYGGNKAPLTKEFKEENGEKRYPNLPKYFHELSGEGDFKRLGVLKMDVDGLGNIFKDISRDNLTFSYYAALSRNLDWFFKGYLNTIWEDNPDFKEYTQIIYSGGDDLFIIGRWDLIIQFSEAIQKAFRRFTCAESLNSEACVTISGGIAIVTDKFPIIKAAALADNAEKAAKSHELSLAEDEKRQWTATSEFKKNSISLLGVSLHWDTEFQLVKELKEELVRYIAPNDNPKLGLPKSLLGKIQIYAAMAAEYEKEKKVYETKKKNGKPLPNAPTPKWIWSIAYDFSRFTDRVKGDNYTFMKKLQDKIDDNVKTYLEGKLRIIDEIRIALFINNWNNRPIVSKYHFIELLSLAARWAELEIRSKQKND